MRTSGRFLFIPSPLGEGDHRITIPSPSPRYGDRIIISRTITRTASSSYKISPAAAAAAGAGGRRRGGGGAATAAAGTGTVAVGGRSAHAELEALMDHLGINATHPLTVITQDMSRKFLAGVDGFRVK